MLKHYWWLAFGTFFLLAACSNDSSKRESEEGPPADSIILSDTAQTPLIEIETFSTPNGWGYDIHIDGKQLIHQPHKPAVGGNRGFDRETQAQKVAELIVQKIKAGKMPPSISRAEMDSIIQVNR